MTSKAYLGPQLDHIDMEKYKTSTNKTMYTMLIHEELQLIAFISTLSAESTKCFEIEVFVNACKQHHNTLIFYLKNQHRSQQQCREERNIGRHIFVNICIQKLAMPVENT